MKWLVTFLSIGILFFAVTALAQSELKGQILDEQLNIETLPTDHEELRKDNTYQWNFPEVEKPKPPPKWLIGLGQFLATIRPILSIVFWVGLVFVVGGLTFLIIREITRIRWNRPKPKDKPEPEVIKVEQPVAAIARSLLEEADQLAAKQRFDEAVHLLLFRSIQDIEKYLPGHVRRSQTSREIELIGSMPDHPRSGFERIRQMVEHSFFGKKALTAGNYKSARSAYEDFAFSKEWA